MTIKLFPEYRNINYYSKYPFTDDSTFLTLNNKTIPKDFIIDACLYPSLPYGKLYICEIIPTTKTIYINHENTLYAQTTYVNSYDFSDIFEIQFPYRKLGTLVYGEHADLYFQEFSGKLEQNALVFCPKVCSFVCQSRVQGFIINNKFYSGRILLCGGPGVHIHTYHQNDKQVLEINFYNTLVNYNSNQKNCIHNPETNAQASPIQQILVTVEEGAPFYVEKENENTINIFTTISLDDICNAKNNKNSKINIPVNLSEYQLSLTPINNRIYFNAPGRLGAALNALNIALQMNIEYKPFSTFSQGRAGVMPVNANMIIFSLKGLKLFE